MKSPKEMEVFLTLIRATLDGYSRSQILKMIERSPSENKLNMAFRMGQIWATTYWFGESGPDILQSSPLPMT